MKRILYYILAAISFIGVLIILQDLRHATTMVQLVRSIFLVLFCVLGAAGWWAKGNES